jgi:hypothetical protein
MLVTLFSEKVGAFLVADLFPEFCQSYLEQNQTLGQKIDELTQRHLRQQDRKFNRWWVDSRRDGTPIQVNHHSYIIEAVVGSGHEGTVYLVQTGAGPKVVKEFGPRHVITFRDPATTSETINLSELKNLAQDFPTPNIIDVDLEHHTAMMDYIPGVPVDMLLASDLFKPDERAKILGKINSFFDRAREKKRPLDLRNLIMTSTLEIYIVDPV